ncbi:MAG: hypothetical protein ACM3NS_04885 [Deltaproteobacteria bacterium]
MNWPDVFLWGLVATLVLSTLLSASQATGVSRMSIPLLLGTLLTGDRDRAAAVGFLLHLVVGWGFALLYALMFQSWGRAGRLLGAAVGLGHGLVVLVIVLPLLQGLHPRVASERTGPEPTRALEPPGFMGLNYGWATPLVTLIAHVLYGAILGGGYRVV